MRINSLIKYFDNHRLVSYITDPQSGLRAFIALHRGGLKTPAFGATRYVVYESESDALKDALQLSRSMSYKAAMAGLKYGGGKGVIIADPKLDKKAMLQAYAEKLNYFNGNFITGADVGLDASDLGLMATHSRFLVGSKSDPVHFTALGLYYSLEATMAQYFGNEDISGKSFAIQGLGKVGSALLSLIYERAGNIYVADIRKDVTRKIKSKYPKVHVVDTVDIYKQKVDVFAPCALSNALSIRTIKKLQAKTVVGGANGQLESSDIGAILHRLGILYAPDYVVNAGGLISVVDEYEHQGADKHRIAKRVKNIKDTLKQIFKQSKKKDCPTNIVADQMAEKIFNNH